MPRGALLGLELGLLGAPHFLHKLNTSHIRDPLWTCWEVAQQKYGGAQTRRSGCSLGSQWGASPPASNGTGGVYRHQLQGPVWFCGLVCPRSCAAGARHIFGVDVPLIYLVTFTIASPLSWLWLLRVICVVLNKYG